MKALVSGTSSLSPEYLFLLEEPVPFELSINFRENLILGETAQEMRPFLRQLRELLPENDLSARRLLEAINQAPKSRANLGNQLCDINLEKDEDLDQKLTGTEFGDIRSLLEMNAVRGDSRKDLFDRSFRRLVISASSICIVDRYFGNQFSADDFQASGAFWALERILESDVPLIRILTSEFNSSQAKIEFRLRELHERSSGATRIEVYLGRSVHNRHVTFNFTGGSAPFSIILDKGLEVFQHEKLREGPGISPLHFMTASNNEAQVMNSHSRVIKIERFTKISA